MDETIFHGDKHLYEPPSVRLVYDNMTRFIRWTVHMWSSAHDVHAARITELSKISGSAVYSYEVVARPEYECEFCKIYFSYERLRLKMESIGDALIIRQITLGSYEYKSSIHLAIEPIQELDPFAIFPLFHDPVGARVHDDPFLFRLHFRYGEYTIPLRVVECENLLECANMRLFAEH